LEVILDTNALSAFADAEPDAVAHISVAQVVAIPVVVLGEYRFGVSQSRRRSEYEAWLAESIRVCRVLEITSATASRYAELRLDLKRAGKPIPSNDLWIAALCREHNLPLLSKDRHFDYVRGIRRIGW
jgi:tRNA(fMet)-specific endonuclease VapC